MRKIEQRKRNRQTRKRNPFVIIGCEGKNKTEKIYFKNFHSKKCIVKFANGNSTDPKGIVQDIINYVESEIDVDENDKIYAVFDTDVSKNKQSQIEEAKKLANKHGVEIITSTPSFELWFLLHFEYTTKLFVSNKELQSYLKNYIEGYAKNNNTYLDISTFTKEALKNSKRLEKYHCDKGQALDNVDCNPYTSVYKVVDELIKRNEK